MKEWKNVSCIDIIKNENLSIKKGPKFLTEKELVKVKNFHESLNNYIPTPLIRLKNLAEKLGVKDILIKDEFYRFGLKAFKGLGGIYALSRVVCDKFGLDIENLKFSDLESMRDKLSHMVFITATDGNHGKGIAWAASQLGCKAYVYMPKGSSKLRAEAIRKFGADVTITDVGYDDTVRYAAEMSNKNGWYLVQDTSWDGYEKIPSWIIEGYTTMGAEVNNQLKEYKIERPTHIFLQAGVGAMAGGILGYFANKYEDKRPIFSIVEPNEVACIYESVKNNDGKTHAATGSGVTIMAGLNCGEPCTITWPILRDFATFYFSCPDFVSIRGMRIAANPLKDDKKVVSGESGAVTLGLLTLLLEKPEFKEIKSNMDLNKDSIILLFNTEGDTDPEIYKKIIKFNTGEIDYE